MVTSMNLQVQIAGQTIRVSRQRDIYVGRVLMSYKLLHTNLFSLLSPFHLYILGGAREAGR